MNTKLNDAEKNNSTEMNATSVATSSCDGDVKVLFIGNSITLHGSLPEIGWTNVWGMAASSEEKDYVHIVTRGIEAKTGRKAKIKVYSAATFERNYKNPDFTEIDELVPFRPDYLIVALGENVPNLETQEDRLAYRSAFRQLLSRFVYDRMQPNAVVRGVFWTNEDKDFEMRHAASDFSFTFVNCGDLGQDDSMKAIGLFEHTGVAAHPGDKGMAAIAERILEAFFPTQSGYSAKMNGKPVDVRPIRVSAMPFNQWAASYQRPMDQTEIAGMVNVEVEGPTNWSVHAERTFTKAVIRPLSAGVKPVVADGEIHFTLPKSGYYVLELDDEHCPLEIFANPKRDFAKEKALANIVFGPGLHEPVVVKIKSHDRVYIDKDAVVKGSFQIDGAEDVVISGYGIIDGGRNCRVGHDCYRDGMDTALRIIDSKNVKIDGPVVLDSSCWCVSAFNSADIEISDIKVTGAWRYNTDGIDICNSQRVKVWDCYVHSFDDALVVKGLSHFNEACKGNDLVEDISFSHCVCWCSWGRTLENGLETWAARFRNISFEDCDLIHNNAAALSVHIGGPAKLENILYRNIRVEFCGRNIRNVIQKERDQQFVPVEDKSTSGCLYAINNYKMFGNGFFDTDYDYTKEPLGTVDNLRIENITVYIDEGAPAPRCWVKAEQDSQFGSISIEKPKIISFIE